ncbi:MULTISPECIES: nuclear transport factor 2 family protein [Luteimonas]|uniref:nuclear transport factor 2 family protein n=1 Tax=Luteimonas TaxID=83614 RepID=UPI000C79F497|nr:MULTISPECIES: nuclear transport factor 2 family protein [Luteimonas]
MSDPHKTVLQQANAAIEQGDIEGFLAYCTEDVAWTAVGAPTIEGKAAVRAWMAETYRTPPEFTVHRLIAEDDMVVAIGEITSRDERGVETRNAYSDVWQFRDGRMAALQAFVVALPEKR